MEIDLAKNHITPYEGIKKFYFEFILDQIIRIADLHNQNKQILDYGSGLGFLKKKLINSKNNIINYDIVKELSDVNDWKSINFDIIVFNQVLDYLSENEITQLIKEIKEINPNSEIIYSVGYKSIIKRAAMYVLNKRDAYDGMKTSEEKQYELLKPFFNIKKTYTIFFLHRIFLLKFKE